MSILCTFLLYFSWYMTYVSMLLKVFIDFAYLLVNFCISFYGAKETYMHFSTVVWIAWICLLIF